MATFKDAEGNDVEAFTQAEMDAQIEAKIKEATAPKVEAPKADDTKPAPFDPEAFRTELLKTAKGEVENIVKAEKLAVTKTTMGARLDADTRKVFDVKFDNLTGYADTPEGYAARASDAYILATGNRPAADFGLNNLMASGGGKSMVDTKITSDIDRGVRAALNISDADVEKFSKK